MNENEWMCRNRRWEKGTNGKKKFNLESTRRYKNNGVNYWKTLGEECTIYNEFIKEIENPILWEDDTKKYVKLSNGMWGMIY